MSSYNPQAEQLNKILQEKTPAFYDLLSEKGKAIFFPKKGILGQTAEAKGKEINATIGVSLEEDGSPVRLEVIEKLVNLDPGEIFFYAPSFGNLEMREVWQKLLYEKNPSLKAKISLPVVTSGVTHSLSIAAFLFLDPGDKVIITDKYWGNYNLIFNNSFDAQLDEFNTFKYGGFDIEAMKEKLFSEGKKKVLLLNFPNNPSGYTPTNKEAKEIVEVIEEAAKAGKEIVVISDDSYFGLVYKDDVFEESLFAKMADLHENVLAVKLDGATKEYFVWGLRSAFITFAGKGADENVLEALASKAAGAVRANISNASNLSQNLVCKSLSDPAHKKQREEKVELLRARFEAVEKALEDEKYKEYFTSLPCNSGYFICIELANGLDGEEVRQVLLKDFDTGVISMGNLLRLAFSSVSASKISTLFENIYKACKKVKGV